MVISGGIVTPPDRRANASELPPMTSARLYEEADLIREGEAISPRVDDSERPGEKAVGIVGRYAGDRKPEPEDE